MPAMPRNCQVDTRDFGNGRDDVELPYGAAPIATTPESYNRKAVQS